MADFEARYVCHLCGREFKKYPYFEKHIETKACQRRFECLHCHTSFTCKRNLKHHVKVTHANYENVNHIFVCGFCEKRFASREEAKLHRQSHIQRVEAGGGAAFGFERIAHAHKKKCELMNLTFPNRVRQLEQALQYIFEPLHLLLLMKQVQHSRYKVSFVLHIEFVKLNEFGNVDTMIVAPFRSPTQEVMPFMNLEPLIIEAFYHLLRVIEEFTCSGSSWMISDVVNFQVEFARCRPLSGGCGLHEVEYVRGENVTFTNDGFDTQQSSQQSADVSKKQSAEGDKQNCFFLAVASHFVKGRKKIEKFVKSTLVKKIPTPVQLDDIKQFETDNSELNLSINVVFKDEQNKIYPVYVSKLTSAANIITLMMCVTGTSNSGSIQLHYAYVREPNKLLCPRERNSDERIIRTRSTSILCYNCMNFKHSREAYENHIRWCHQESSQVVHMPREGETVSYRDKGKIKLGYTLFFDFESVSVPIHRDQQCSCDSATIRETLRAQNMTLADYQDDAIDDLHEEIMLNFGRPINRKRLKLRRRKKQLCEHKSRMLKEQKVISYALLLVDRANRIVAQKFYIGEDALEHFMKTLFKLEKKYVKGLINSPAKMKLTSQDHNVIRSATDCWHCGEILGMDRVNHHDHIDGHFIGVIHNACNLLLRESNKICCFSHSFMTYESHYVVSILPKFKKKINTLKCIPLNSQRFKMLQINNLIFLDSYSFLSESLEKLVATLTDDSNYEFYFMKSRNWSDIVDKFHGRRILKRGKEPRESMCRDLLLRKGVYPYSFATSYKQLEETKSLPAKEHFFNELGDVDISDEDYEHAKSVWRNFKCESLLDFTLVYNAGDVYQLAEVMTNLRESIWDRFGLDVAHYVSLPMLSKDIFLMETQCDLHLISDQEISHAFSSSIRGGLSFIGLRYVDVPEMNRTMEKGSSVSLCYLDVNNL